MQNCTKCKTWQRRIKSSNTDRSAECWQDVTTTDQILQHWSKCRVLTRRDNDGSNPPTLIEVLSVDKHQHLLLLKQLSKNVLHGVVASKQCHNTLHFGALFKQLYSPWKVLQFPFPPYILSSPLPSTLPFHPALHFPHSRAHRIRLIFFLKYRQLLSFITQHTGTRNLLKCCPWKGGKGGV